MQRYWDLTERERAELTHEQIDALSQIELMEQGIVSIEPPELEPVDDIDVPRQQFYEVLYAGEYGQKSLGICFDTMERAEQFIALRPQVAAHDWQTGDKYKYADPCSDMRVSPVLLSDKRSIASVKNILADAKNRRERNNQKMNEYNKAVSDRVTATAGLHDDWHKCREQARRMEKIKKTFEEYTTLTNGNTVMAKAFLAKAFPERDIAAAEDWFSVSMLAAEPAEAETKHAGS